MPTRIGGAYPLSMNNYKEQIFCPESLQTNYPPFPEILNCTKGQLAARLIIMSCTAARNLSMAARR
jgi:hypothetical protein